MKFTIADVKTFERVTDKVFESAREAKNAFSKLKQTKGLFIMAIADEQGDDKNGR